MILLVICQYISTKINVLIIGENKNIRNINNIQNIDNNEKYEIVKTNYSENNSEDIFDSNNNNKDNNEDIVHVINDAFNDNILMIIR